MMALKARHFLLACLILTSFFDACVNEQNQTVPLQVSPNIESTFTQVPATATLTSAPTSRPTFTETPLPTATGTFAYPLPTLPPDCGKVILGKAGTQSVDHLEQILIQGTAILCGQIYFSPDDRPRTISVEEAKLDLDTGTIDAKTADIEFCPGAGSDIFYYLCDINNVLMKAYGFTSEKQEQPTFEDCIEISQRFESTNDNEPVYACVITNSGNIARIKVEKYDPLGEYVLAWEISFITWEK
jgi:hypothetical protein